MALDTCSSCGHARPDVLPTVDGDEQLCLPCHQARAALRDEVDALLRGTPDAPVQGRRCPCGNAIHSPDTTLCEWCEDLQAQAAMQAVPHTWQRARFTGAVTCSVCRLHPIDADDMVTDCVR